MAEPKLPPAERILVSFQQLAIETDICNTAAEELAAEILNLEKALLTIKPKVSAWYRIAGSDDSDFPDYWSRSIGYAKINDTWAIGIKREWGNEAQDHHNSEEWLFKNAPQWMVIEGAGKLPELFEEIVKRTKEATDKLKARTIQTKDLVAAVTSALPPTNSTAMPRAKTRAGNP